MSVLHYRQGFVQVFTGKVARVRLPITSSDLIVGAVPEEARQRFYTEISAQAETASAIYSAAGFVFPAAFVGFEVMGSACTVDALTLAVTARASAASVEVRCQ